jgi:hypothetical protein
MLVESRHYAVTGELNPSGNVMRQLKVPLVIPSSAPTSSRSPYAKVCPDGWRLYYLGTAVGDPIVIGYIGPHLRTQSDPR